jgi:hypothetical protein
LKLEEECYFDSVATKIVTVQIINEEKKNGAPYQIQTTFEENKISKDKKIYRSYDEFLHFRKLLVEKYFDVLIIPKLTNKTKVTNPHKISRNFNYFFGIFSKLARI